MAIEMTFDEFEIDPKAFDEAELKHICMQEIEYSIGNSINKIDRGENVDGGKMRPYSPGYVAAIKAGKVKAKNGVHKVDPNTVNLRISSDLHESRRPVEIADGAEGRFEGDHGKISNAQLAAFLMDKGFKDWHAFGKDDVERIQKRFDELVRKMSEKAIKVKRTR